MTTGPGVGGRLEPGGRPEVRPLAKARAAIRSEIFATPTADLDAKIAQLAQMFPHLFTEMEVVDTTEGEPDLDAVEDLEGEDEDEGPELSGQDGEPYQEDPDGDFSGGYSSPRGWASRSPDVRITEVGPDHARRLQVELGPLPAWAMRVDRSRRPAPGWIIEAIEERAERLLEVGRVIVSRQRAFFAAASKNEAVGLLEPLTRDEVARQVGLEATRFIRLIKGKTVETPRFGAVGLSLFFGRARARVPGRVRAPRLRPESLANHIRLLMDERSAAKWTTRELRQELERRRLLPPSETAKAVAAAERRIRRARTLIE